MTMLICVASDPDTPRAGEIRAAVAKAGHVSHAPGCIKSKFPPEAHKLLDELTDEVLDRAGAFMLVLPSTGAALIEFGYGIGNGKPAVLVALDDTEPLDLEYLKVPVLKTMEEVREWLSNVQEVPDDDWPW